MGLPHKALRPEGQVDRAVRSLEELGFLQILPVGLAVLDTRLRFAWINAELARINGRSVEQHIGRSLGEILPDLSPTLEPVLRRVLESGEPVFNITGKVGRAALRTWSASYLPLKDPSGAVVAVCSVVEETTERLQAAERIREQARMLEAVFKYTLDCVVLLDPKYNFLRVNDTYAKLTGKKPSEFIGKNHFDFYPSDAKMLFDNVVASKTPLETFARPFVYPDDPKRGVSYWDWSLVPILDSGGEVEFLVFTLRDVTQRKYVELELSQRKEELETLLGRRGDEIKSLHRELLLKERLAALGQLVATVSHELRNPLSVILTSAYLLKKQLGEHAARVAPVLESLGRNVDRCNRIIEELLEFVKVSDLHREDIDIDRWLHDLLAAQIKPPWLSLNLIPSSHATVSADRERLGRCVVNIISNAFQAMENSHRPAHRLTVESRVSRGRLEMRFTDTGTGIPHEIRDRLFEPLFSTKPFGIGLGLPIVKQIMEKHGGGVEIDSVESEGTTVTLWLPLENRAGLC